MNRASSALRALVQALLLAVAVASAAHAGQVQATFTVSATLVPGGGSGGGDGGGGTCRASPITGLVLCGPTPTPTPRNGGQLFLPLAPAPTLLPGVGVQPRPLLTYRTFEGFIWLIDPDAPSSFSSLLGAWSNTRIIQFGGREYLEMTVSW